jgi:kynurenine formamidase
MIHTGKTLLTEQQFDELANRLSNWGRWGADDEAGTLNFITPDKIKAAAGLVRDGRPVSLALDMAVNPAANNPRPVRHLVYRSDNTAESGAFGDHFSLDPHGSSITHIDALSHMYYKGKGYNDRPIGHIGISGAKFNTFKTLTNGVTSRGVLLDLPRAAGKKYFEANEVATAELAQKALKDAGVTVQSGDILVIRTGKNARFAEKGITATAQGLSGLSIDCAEWVHQSEVSAIISDCAIDPQPSEVTGVRIPWHMLTLVWWGMPIVDNADPEALAATCAELGRWDFFLTIAPIRLMGGTGAPVNPIAIF